MKNESDPNRSKITAATFTVAVFLNAALLFSVQPMFSKMALPLLGGTPAVWNTCMLFFQAALLGGYLYAHLTTSKLSIRRHVPVHVALLALSGLVLPIGIAANTRPPANGSPVLWLVGVLTVSIGAPFLMLSTGAPLLQRWFSQTNHRDAANPYFLYAASNLGSMVALLAYPAVLERTMSLAMQGLVWTVGYVVLVVLIAVCGIIVRKATPAPTTWETTIDAAVARIAPASEPLTTRRRLRWVALSAVPSSMLLGVTTYLSTDVAAIPLLWIVPLALYLLTFVVAFSSREWFRPALVLGLQAVFLVWLAMTMSLGLSGLVAVMAPAHLGLLFLTGLACHGALSHDRPPARQLTEFYLWISLGGMLGGLFNALIAPHVFSTVAEYPIAIAAAALLRPTRKPAGTSSRVLDIVLPVALAVGVVLLLRRGFPVPGWSMRTSIGVFSIAALICLTFYSRPLRFALGLAAIFGGSALGLLRTKQVVYRARSFFGVNQVVSRPPVFALFHGTTMHGAQSRTQGQRLEPLTYYHRNSPIGVVFERLMQSMPVRRVGVIGLGVGSLACYGRDGEPWTYFEIDPLVERIARDDRYFTFLRDCPPKPRVVIGDGRLSLAAEPDSSFDLIVVDAFGSDAIPVHLLTREATALYLRKLRPDGIVAFHISNRYLDLEPVVATTAKSLGAPSLVGVDGIVSSRQAEQYKSLSKWVMVSRSAPRLAPLMELPGWGEPVTRSNAVWTDDFSNVLGVFKWQRQ
jgi:hypothetical protein